MKSKNIGITGSTGVLGKILIQKLNNPKKNISCFKKDISIKKEVDKWIEKNDFDFLIHLAAIVPTKIVKEDFKRAWNVNVNGTKNLLESLNNQGKVPWFFYASTSHVYKSKNSPINEQDEIEPISDYGKTKYEAEKIITQNYKNYCIGRIFSFYSDTQKKPFLYPSIKERLKEENLNKPFELYGADSVRDFLDAKEVAEIILKLMEKQKTGIYNIGSGKGIKIRDFVQSLTPVKLNINKKGNSDYLVANINKLEKALRNNGK